MSGLNELLRRILFLPPQASTFARSIDTLHYFVITTTMVASGLCGLTALLFYIRYRRRQERQRTTYVTASWRFEAVAVTVPLTFFLVWWVIGFRQFVAMETPPANAMTVYAMGKQWMWKFSYSGGPNSIGTLHVPAHRPVRVLLTSRDVIHSFYVPAFRIKKDVLPGRYTELWFEAVAAGHYQIFCAEMCGIGHSAMLGEVVVHEAAEFEDWLANERRGLAAQQDAGHGGAGPGDADLLEQGRVAATEAGCLKCHTVDGAPHIGPTWLDLYRRKETMTTGEVIEADERYLTESMMDPLAHIVAGYNPVMPTYQGRLAAPEAAAILEYIKSLRSAEGGRINAGRPVYDPTRAVSPTIYPLPPAAKEQK